MTTHDLPPGVVLRGARPDDAEAIARIWAPGWHDAHDGHVSAALTALRTDRSFAERAPGIVPRTCVAELDGHVVGFVTVEADQVEQLYVDPAARGTGVAAALLRRATTTATQARVPVLWLAVVAGNARARRFYERQGWVDGGPYEHVVPGTGGAAVTVPVRRYTWTSEPVVLQVSAVVLRRPTGEVLTVRKRGTHRFMLPGGKPEPGETPAQTAVREAYEEVGAVLDATRLRELGTFRAAAANEPGYEVVGTVFEHPGVVDVAPGGEIAELRWLDPTADLPDDLAPLLEERVLPLLA